MYPILELSPSLQIPTYFLVTSIASCIAMIWLWRRTLARNLNANTALDLTMVIFISGFIGARLLHVLWEDPKFYWENPTMIFNIFAGGYVFLGGLIGGALGAYGYCRIKSEPFWQWADLAAPVAALGYALGRIGCLLRGCCYGKVCDLPWAISIDSVHRHPTQAYATIIELAIVFSLLWLERKPSKPGTLFLTWLILHGTARVFLEIFRDDPRGPAPLGISLATWLSLILISFALRYRNRV